MIDTATWDDPWFAELAPDTKLVFLYLLTNRRSTAAGAFEITPRHMAFETGIDQQRIVTILEELHPRIHWWPEHQIVWIRNFFKHQAANDKFTISAQRHVAKLPVDVQQVIATVYPDLVCRLQPDPPDTHTPAEPTQEPPPDTHDIPTTTGMDTHPLVKGSRSREGRDRGEEEEPRKRGDANAPASVSDPPPPEPKPRTPKQQASDRKFQRSSELFAAYCRGLGIDPDGDDADVYRDRAFRELKPVVDKPVPFPDDVERLTRFLSRQTWREEPPKVPHVLGSYAGWASKGKPDEPEPKPTGQSRASPNGKGPPDWSWREKYLDPDDASVIDVEVKHEPAHRG